MPGGVWPAPLWLALLGAAPSAAADRTPEEAVAYLVAGMTDGATVGTSVFRRTGTSPATFATDRAKPSDHEPRVSIVVTRRTSCIFEISLTIDQGHDASQRLDTLDFAKVKAIRYVGREQVKVTGSDYCKGNLPPACNGQLAADVLPEQYQQAYAVLRRSCP